MPVVAEAALFTTSWRHTRLQLKVRLARRSQPGCKLDGLPAAESSRVLLQKGTRASAGGWTTLARALSEPRARAATWRNFLPALARNDEPRKIALPGLCVNWLAAQFRNQM